ncbi:MAG TPA: hypothetical protein VLA04_02560 [Verrucomicrobiae bacterium]|nr:hypothetical protein [Verrucomicrobiae bacterium]
MSTPEWRANNQDKLREYRRLWYYRNVEHAKAKVLARRMELVRFIEEIKANLSCEVCGENHPRCLDFHHRDPAQKKALIGGIARKKSWKKERIIEEINKCSVLCSNCHRKYHASIGP